MKKLRLLLAMIMAIAFTPEVWAQGITLGEISHGYVFSDGTFMYRYKRAGLDSATLLYLIGYTQDVTSDAVTIPKEVGALGTRWKFFNFNIVPDPLVEGGEISCDYEIDDIWKCHEADNVKQLSYPFFYSRTNAYYNDSKTPLYTTYVNGEIYYPNLEILNFYKAYTDEEFASMDWDYWFNYRNDENTFRIEFPDDFMRNHTKLKRVEMPVLISSIGNHAFDGCSSLNYFLLTDSLRYIGDYAFNGCTSLSSSTFFDVCVHNPLEIGEGAFKGCTALPKATFNANVTLGKQAFANCTGLTQISFAQSATIGDEAFKGCTGLPASQLTFSKPVAIGTGAFSGTKVTSFVFNDTVTLAKDAFKGASSATAVTIQRVSPSTSENAFENSYVKTLTVNEMNLSKVFLKNASNLEAITFPSNFYQQTSLPNGFFDGCTKLTQQLVFPKLEYIGPRTFAGIQGLNLKIGSDHGFYVDPTAFAGSTGTVYVKYGLKAYFSGLSAFNNLTIVEYDAPDLKASEEVAAANLSTWYSTYTSTQLSVLKHLKVTGELTDDGLTAICNLCKNDGSSVQLQTLDLTEVTNETLEFPANAMTLDTLLLPRATTQLATDFFNRFKNDIVVVAPWTTNLPPRTWTPAAVSNKTLIVPRGSLYTYKAAEGWKSFGTIKTEPIEGDVKLLVVSDRCDKPIELWSGGSMIGTISKKGGTISQMLTSPTSVELRIPTTYLDGILFNGADVKSVLAATTPTETAYEGYKFYIIEDFTDVTSIELTFADVPVVFEPYNLVFEIWGGAGTANVTITYGDGTNETFDITHNGNGSTIGSREWGTASAGPKSREVQRIVVTTNPANAGVVLYPFGCGFADFTRTDNGDGTTTYTLEGRDMTSNRIWMAFPEEANAPYKTTIQVNGSYEVKYFFGFHDEMEQMFNYVQYSDNYINGTVTLNHGGDTHYAVHDVGEVYIYAAEGNKNFRVIYNGADVTSQCEYVGNVRKTSYQTYEYYKSNQTTFPTMACYYFAIPRTEMAQDSWIIVDDGTTPLEEIVTPLQVSQTVTTMDGTEVLYLIDKNGNEIACAGSGNVKTWPKGEPMTVEAANLRGSTSYEAKLIVDGTEIPLQYDAEKNRFIGYELSEVNTSHTIVLQMKKVKKSFTAYVGLGNSVSLTEIDEAGNVIAFSGGAPESIGLDIANTSGLLLTFTPAEGNVLTGLAVDGCTIPLDDENLIQKVNGEYEYTLPAGTISTGDHQVYATFSGPEGDMNHDGSINIADVTKLVNEILK